MNVAKISSARCSHSQPTKGAVASDGKPSTTALMRNACSSSYVAVGVTRLDDCVGGANLNRALVRNVRTYTAMPREKAQVATTTRPKVPMRRLGADCLVVVMKRGNARGAKGAGHRHWRGSTGNGRNPLTNGRRQPSCDGTSRISREAYVRFCERLGVKFPGPTRHGPSRERRLCIVINEAGPQQP